MKYSHKEILRTILEYKSLKQTELARLLGVPSSNINGVLKGRLGSMSKKILTELVEKFPEISPEWLLTGEGEMLKPDLGEKKYKPPEVEYLQYFSKNLIHLRQTGILSAETLTPYISESLIQELEEGRARPTLEMLVLIRDKTNVGIDEILFLDLQIEENMKNAIETVATLKKIRESQKENEDIRATLKAMQEMMQAMQDRLDKMEREK